MGDENIMKKRKDLLVLELKYAMIKTKTDQSEL